MKKIPFKIQYIDSFGQGVSKILDKVTLIPKTLVGEEGEAIVFEEHSKWQKAITCELLSSSPDRIQSACPHFDTCSGCHYLTMDYEQEVELKKNHLKFLFKKLYPHFEFEFIPALNRFHYRNRIQLHYNKNKLLLGFFDSTSKSIVPVFECKIVKKELKTKLEELYQKNSWLKLVEDQPNEGHIEIYLKNKIPQISVNQKYAEGGFTQVNHEMNLLLLDQINQTLKSENCFNLNFIELFAGNGNLTHELSGKSLCVDYYKSLPQRANTTFYHANLYSEKEAKELKKTIKNLNYPLLILDPPRSGFSDLKKWSDEFQFKNILYVSCNPQTLLRDLTQMNDYEIVKGFGIDLFPGTFHFETMVFLRLKSQ